MTLNNLLNLLSNKSINRRILVLMLLVAIIPLLVCNIFNLKKAISIVKQQSLERMEVLAKNKAIDIQRYLSGSLNLIEFLSSIDINKETLIYLEKYYYKNISVREKNKPVISNAIKLIRNFKQHNIGIEDIYIVTNNGFVALSLLSNRELDSNLLNGQFSKTGLGEVYKNTKLLMGVNFTKFEYYAPTKKMAMFISSPVHQKEKIIGQVILQLKSNQLIEIASDYTGMGKTGETVIAARNGDDALVLTPLRFNKDSAFTQKIFYKKDDIQPIIYALNGKSSSGLFNDYRGIKVLAAWQYIKELHWGLVVKIDEEEVNQEITSLWYQTILILVVTIMLTSIVSVLFSRSLSKPIRKLNDSVQKILESGWDMDKVEEITTTDRTELGALAYSFNALIFINAENEVQRKQANSERARLTSLLDEIVTSATVGIMTINEKQEIIFFNLEAEMLFGYNAEEVQGKKMTMLIPEYARASHQHNINNFKDSPIEKIIDREASRELSLQGLHKDGHIFLAAVGISKSQLPDGSWTFTAFIRDSTKERMAEKEIKEAMINSEKANQTKSEFLANMSHELRTPMHGILSYSQLGISRAKTSSPEKLHGYFTNIETSGVRLLGLLNNLLDLAKLESGKMELQKNNHNFDKVVNDCIVELAAKCDEHKLKISIDKPKAEINIYCDALRIKQVIINLLSNAIKFSPEGSVITIKYFVDIEKYFVFQVIDQGTGISGDKLEKIFDKFIQEDGKGTGTGMGSTGLGLAISKEIIIVHKGKIWVENSEKKDIGAIFCFRLPFVMDNDV